MKFTEGYWLRNEKANALYAESAYEMQKIPGGMKILVPMRKIGTRGDTVNVPCLTVEFCALENSVIQVNITHFCGYDTNKPCFELKKKVVETEVIETEEAYIMHVEKLTVRVIKKEFAYTFEADGKVITKCGFRNLGYMRWNRENSTMLPEENYLEETKIKPYIVNELSLAPNESVYGFGERFTQFVKNGQVIETWNEDGGTSSSIAYKSIPFYVTNKGYGVLVNHTGNVSFEVASEKVECVGFAVEDESMEYFFFYGPNLHDVLKKYTALSGKPALPPAWSFGLWLSTSFTTDYDETTMRNFAEEMKQRDLPASVLHYDTFWMREFRLCDFEWDEVRFPNPVEMIKENHAQGKKVCVWINPYVAQHTKKFEEAKEKGYLLKRRDGKGIWQTDNWEYGMGIVDFTNPSAKEWFQRQLIELLELGVDCFKTDFGERIPINVEYYNKSDPVAMHNYYTYLYNQCVFECLEKFRGKKEAVLFARSATVGSQQFPVHWGGDCMASYASMAETLRGGLSLAMCGFSFWSHDISGFESTATPDLYKRWVAFGMLSSHSRLHGSSSYRVPWTFDEEACDVVRFFSNLKCRLMPYIYGKAVEAHCTGVPLMRPMVLEFMEEPAVRYLDMQYMFGDALLVAPVFREDGIGEYYLPKGRWTSLLTGEVRDGGRWYEEKYDYFSLPLYVKENTLLPIGWCKDEPDYEYQTDLEVYWFAPGKQNSAELTIVGNTGEICGKIFAQKYDESVDVKITGKLPGVKFAVFQDENCQINLQES